MTVDPAAPTDLTELAALAAQTFPLACPPSVTPENIAAFIAQNLSEPKIYVLPDAHGGTVSAALMGAAVDDARRRGAAVLWLGVNQKNQRAQRFYAKQGLSVAGTKTFTVGAAVENDYVMVRPL